MSEEVLPGAGRQRQGEQESGHTQQGHARSEIGSGRPPAAYADEPADGDERDGHHGQRRVTAVGHAQAVPDATEAEEGERGVTAGVGARSEHRDPRRVGGPRAATDQGRHHPGQLEGRDDQHQHPRAQPARHSTRDGAGQGEQAAGRGQGAEGGPEDGGRERGPRAGSAVRRGRHEDPRQRGVPEDERPLTERHPLDHERVPDGEARRGQPRRRTESGGEAEDAPAGKGEREQEQHPTDDGPVDDGRQDRDHGIEGHRAWWGVPEPERGVGERLVGDEHEVAREEMAGMAERRQQDQRQREWPQDEQHPPRAGHPSSDRPYPGRRSA